MRLYTIPIDNESWMMDNQYSSLINQLSSLMNQYNSLQTMVQLVPAKVNCTLHGVLIVEPVLLHAITLRCLNLLQTGSLYRKYVLPTKNTFPLLPLELYGLNLPMLQVYQNLFYCRTSATFHRLHTTCSPLSSLHVTTTSRLYSVVVHISGHRVEIDSTSMKKATLMRLKPIIQHLTNMKYIIKRSCMLGRTPIRTRTRAQRLCS